MISELLQWSSSLKSAPDEDCYPISNLIYLLGQCHTNNYEQLRFTSQCFFDRFAHELNNDDLVFSKFVKELAKFKTNFYDSLASIGVESFRLGIGNTFHRETKNLANLSSENIFRFFSAWSAFNLNDLETARSEIEKMTPHTSSSQSLLGQILLEQEEYEQSIDSFNSAIKIDSNNDLAWFFLAKIYYSMDESDKAWTCLKRCEAINTSAIEIIILQSYIALESKNIHYCEIILFKIKVLALNDNTIPCELFVNFIKIAIFLNNIDELKTILSFDQIDVIKNDRIFYNELSRILLDLGDKKLHKEAFVILDGILKNLS